MNDLSFYKKKILLLGSGELGKELVIESKRLGLEVIAIDRYENAPAMQVADHSLVIDMNNKIDLKKTIKEIKPDFVVPEIESLSIEALKEIEKEGIKIIPNARTVEMTMNRDKIRDLASKDLNIRTAKFIYVFDDSDLEVKANDIGYPLLLKPLMSSSGKGQSLVQNKNDIISAWNYSQANSRGKVRGVILEEFIDFDFEFTLLTVRTCRGDNIATKNLQDKFLYDLINSNKTVELNLINGLVISCKLEKFDNFSLLINYNNSLTLVYKHSISFISYKNLRKKK